MKQTTPSKARRRAGPPTDQKPNSCPDSQKAGGRGPNSGRFREIQVAPSLKAEKTRPASLPKSPPLPSLTHALPPSRAPTPLSPPRRRRRPAVDHMLGGIPGCEDRPHEPGGGTSRLGDRRHGGRDRAVGCHRRERNPRHRSGQDQDLSSACWRGRGRGRHRLDKVPRRSVAPVPQLSLGFSLGQKAPNPRSALLLHRSCNRLSLVRVR